MSVGKAILRIRHEKQMTQRDVGDRAGLATSYVSRIENGRIQPTMTTLQRMASALGIPVSQIFQVGEQKRERPPHRCPVSSSGDCVGELIRSDNGPPPRGRKAKYGSEELRMLRMADFVALHADRDTRRALCVLLESLVSQTTRNRHQQRRKDRGRAT